MSGGHTPGPWAVSKNSTGRRVTSTSGIIICNAVLRNSGSAQRGHRHGAKELLEAEANARLIAAAPELLEALQGLADVFALNGESSVARFDRLAAMFHRDTGYVAPGKDQPASGVVSSADRDGLNAIYDAWYQAKVDRARAAIAKATAA